MLFWRSFFKNDELESVARDRYAEILAQSRNAWFFSHDGGNVPDTLDGRFEIVCLNAFLVFRRLKSFSARARDLSQAIYDQMFASFDADLREMGAADIGVGRRIKAMAEALNGRIHAYEVGLLGSDPELLDAIRRNVFGTVSPQEINILQLAGYLRRASEHFTRYSEADFWHGPIGFPDPGECRA